MKSILVLVCLCQLLLQTLALYSARDDVVEVTPKNIQSVLDENKQLVAMEFYAPWCGHCQKLVPEWKKVASNLKGLVTVAAVNCDEDTNKSICGRYGIQGFPTIKIFSPDQKKGKKVSDYQGPRDAKHIVDHLLSSQPSEVRYLKWNADNVKSKKSMALEDFYAYQNTTMPKVILFTQKPSTTPLYKAMSVEYSDRVLFGEVKTSEKEIMAAYGISSYPTLILIPPESPLVLFDKSNQKLNSQTLKAFIDPYVHSEHTEEVESKVHIQSMQKLNELCQHRLCVVAVTDEENKADTLSVLHSLDEKRHVYGWIDSSLVSELPFELSDDYPALFLFHSQKHVYRTYMGAYDSKKISQWITQVESGRIPPWSYHPVRDEL